MDVAGDEGSFPLAGLQGEAMVAGVEEAERRGVPLTLHAGEWPERWHLYLSSHQTFAPPPSQLLP